MNHHGTVKHLDNLFERYTTEAMDELSPLHMRNLNNVAVVIEDEPSQQQKIKLRLRQNSLLFGLYEGIPLSVRGTGATVAPPDKITLFKDAILKVSPNTKALKEQIKRTLWHEIAHHYGLDHDQIHKLESKT